jgi:predicted O-methyltransferase YrrM
MVVDMNTIEPIKPLTPLYGSREQFEISAAGLAAWRQSEAFARAVSFYKDYPLRSLQSDEARALLHHLIVMRRPERALELGTYHAGTAEVMARALWEAGHGHLETIDPFGGERCPPIIAAFPPQLRERISFLPINSGSHFDEAIVRGVPYDLVLIDGNHEFEFALFDLMCAARIIRPNGLIVLDNVDQPGPRFATKQFLEHHPEWRDIADVVRRTDPAAPLVAPQPSFPDTKFYILEAPPYYPVTAIPHSFGAIETDRAEVDGIELELAAPARGTLHVQVYVRTFSGVEPEELEHLQSVALDLSKLPEESPIRLPLDRPLHSAIAAGHGVIRRIEILLAFTGEQTLALRLPPLPYPARHGKSIGS